MRGTGLTCKARYRDGNVRSIVKPTALDVRPKGMGVASHTTHAT